MPTLLAVALGYGVLLSGGTSPAPEQPASRVAAFDHVLGAHPRPHKHPKRTHPKRARSKGNRAPHKHGHHSMTHRRHRRTTGRHGGRRFTTRPGHRGFAYGFDYSQIAPEYASWNNPAAVSNAQRVISRIPSLQVQAIMGWGPGNPEPSRGVYDFASLDRRIALVTAAGGTPVLDLCGAPDWMKGGTAGRTNWQNLLVPPTRAHYAAFAHLSAVIAARYPHVKYFIVWKELQGFWDPYAPGPKNGQRGNWDMRSYVKLYNMVYKAIKAVRPDARIGGPYAPVISYSRSTTASTPASPQGFWGSVDQRALNAIAYWARHKVGAAFLAVDGHGFTKDAGIISSPLSETRKFEKVGRWLSRRTRLPIWWMESELQPTGVGWTPAEATAVRIAALIRMREGGISAGLQWQPVTGVGYPDLGLVTNVTRAGGGRATSLVPTLRAALPVLQRPVSEVIQRARNVLAATNSLGTIALNAGTSPARVAVPGGHVRLRAGKVVVIPAS